MEEPRPPHQRGLSDALRGAIESTLSSLGDRPVRHATELRAAAGLGRAVELLDEVARRGHEARAEIVRRGMHTRTVLARRGAGAGTLARRGQEAAAAPAALTARVVEAVWDTLRPGSKPKVEGKE